MPQSGGTGLDYVLSGTYQCASTTTTSCTFTTDTEFELPLLATSIVCIEDALLSWVRYRFWCWGGDEQAFYEWFVIKCQSTDATQDLSSSTVLEDLQREHRIIKRGAVATPVTTSMRGKPIMIELFNLKLVRGEELRLLVRPLYTGTASHGKYIELCEWRQVGV